MLMILNRCFPSTSRRTHIRYKKLSPSRSSYLPPTWPSDASLGRRHQTHNDKGLSYVIDLLVSAKLINAAISQVANEQRLEEEDA